MYELSITIVNAKGFVSQCLTGKAWTYLKIGLKHKHLDCFNTPITLNSTTVQTSAPFYQLIDSLNRCVQDPKEGPEKVPYKELSFSPVYLSNCLLIRSI